MNKINYDGEMQKILNGLSGRKPTLLLHACCAPCASACLERLKDFFDITVYFYNPNMDGEEEYRRRASELSRLAERFNIKSVIENFAPNEFYSAIKGLESEREGGARCKNCFELRLKKTADYARKNEFEFFATTLTVSPLKNAQVLNDVGLSFNTDAVKYLPTDFKKRGGYARSVELSKELGLYRQNYCGCEFSKRRDL